MREVIVETKGKGVRKIQVGIDWDKVKKGVEKHYVKKSVGIVCSPRTLSYEGTDTESPRESRSWKTPKKGKPKPKKPWQKHGEIKRRKHGRRRWLGWPSVRILNEMGLCIYPYTDVEEEYFWENLSEDFVDYLMEWDQIKRR